MPLGFETHEYNLQCQRVGFRHHIGAKLPEQNAVPGKFMGFACGDNPRPEIEEWLIENNYFQNIWLDIGFVSAILAKKSIEQVIEFASKNQIKSVRIKSVNLVRGFADFFTQFIICWRIT